MLDDILLMKLYLLCLKKHLQLECFNSEHFQIVHKPFRFQFTLLATLQSSTWLTSRF